MKYIKNFETECYYDMNNTKNLQHSTAIYYTYNFNPDLKISYITALNICEELNNDNIKYKICKYKHSNFYCIIFASNNIYIYDKYINWFDYFKQEYNENQIKDDIDYVITYDNLKMLIDINKYNL